MPISTTVKRLDGGIEINADGIVSGFTTVSGVIYRGAIADPNGVISATDAALFLGDGAYQGNLWIKTSLGISNSQWIQAILV